MAITKSAQEILNASFDSTNNVLKTSGSGTSSGTLTNNNAAPVADNTGVLPAIATGRQVVT